MEFVEALKGHLVDAVMVSGDTVQGIVYGQDWGFLELGEPDDAASVRMWIRLESIIAVRLRHRSPERP